MPRIDDYKQALEIGIKQLSDKNPNLVADYSGGTISGSPDKGLELSLRFLGQDIVSPWPDLCFSKMNSKDELPIQQQVLLVHYLTGAWASGGAPVTGNWIAFQEVPDGRFYLDAFMKRAKIPLIKAFGQDPESMKDMATQAFDAMAADHGDVSVIIPALPLVPVSLILWRGDEEFPPEGNILFDQNISNILSAEDIAWLAGMVVYPLAGMARKK